ERGPARELQAGRQFQGPSEVRPKRAHVPAAKQAATGIRALNPQPGDIIAAGAAADGFEDGRLFAVTFQVQKPAALGSIELSVEELNGTDFANQLPPVHERSVRLTAPQRQM